MLSDKVIIQLPRSITNDFINITTMSHAFVPLRFVHHGAAFARMGQRVVADCKYEIHTILAISGNNFNLKKSRTSNDEINIGEKIFRLHQLSSMSLMKQIVNSIRIHADWTGGWPSFGHVDGNFDGSIASLFFLYSCVLVAEGGGTVEGLENGQVISWLLWKGLKFLPPFLDMISQICPFF